MLPSSRRVTRKLFDTVLKSSHAFHSTHFSARVSRLSDPLAPARLSVVVASSVLRKAHDRNLLKRRARAVLEKQLPGMKNGFAAAFFAKKSAAHLDFAGIETDIEILLRKAGLMVL